MLGEGYGEMEGVGGESLHSPPFLSDHLNTVLAFSNGDTMNYSLDDLMGQMGQRFRNPPQDQRFSNPPQLQDQRFQNPPQLQDQRFGNPPQEWQGQYNNQFLQHNRLGLQNRFGNPPQEQRFRNPPQLQDNQWEPTLNSVYG